MSTKVGVAGHAPTVIVSTVNPEALKYQRIWEREEYRKIAPGEELASLFLEVARPDNGANVIDFGCGTGRGALMLAFLGGLKVTMIDFVNNSLDEDIKNALTTQAHVLSFLKADLESKIPVVARYGYCTDVMEHIPPDKVDAVINNILMAAQHVFFSIATEEDRCGKLIDEKLHLTVQPYSWWLSKFQERGCVVHWSQEVPGAGHFYVSAWATGPDVVKTGVLNAEEEKIRQNVRHNIAMGWQQIHPHSTNDIQIMFLGGGPSMLQFVDEIKEKRESGVKLVTFNGAYNWALEQGLKPSAQIIVDARPFNARFTKPVIDECKYLLASQCDPSVFENMPRDRTYLFHSMPNLVGDILDEYYKPGGWHAVPGGSTVLLRAIPMMRMLGYRWFHLYGCDSCLAVNPSGEKLHHAYPQPENDGALVLPVTINPGNRVFYCHPWMVSQAQEFIDTIRKMGDLINLEIHGDGLLSYILEMGVDKVDSGGFI